MKIDDMTFSELDSAGRSRAAPRAGDQRTCKADGAKVIAYDVQFTEPTPRPRGPDDNALDRRESRTPGTSCSRRPRSTTRAQAKVFGGDRALAQARARLGNGNFRHRPGRRDPPHALRARESSRASPWPTAERATGKTGPGPFSVTRADRLRRPGRDDPGGLVLATSARRRSRAGFFRDKIVVVGAVGAVAAGRPPHLVRRRRADVRRRRSRRTRSDGPARLPADARAGLAQRRS